MSFENKGAIRCTVFVTMEPDRSGNFVCDGTADDVQINAALVYVNSLGGGTVCLGEGTYTMADSSRLAIYSNTRLTGMGFNTIIRSPTNIANWRGAVEGANYRVAGPVIDRNIEIDHIKFDGRIDEAVNTASAIIYMENVENIHIHHNGFVDSTGYHVIFQAVVGNSTAGCKGLLLNHNYAENSQFNFFGVSSSHATFLIEDVVVAYNEVLDTDTALSVLGNVQNIVLHGNYLHDNKNVDQFTNGFAIALEVGGGFAARYIVVTENLCHDNRIGIGTIFGGDIFYSCVIANNICERNWAGTGEGYGTDFGGGISTSSNTWGFTIADNNVITSGSTGDTGYTLHGTVHTITGNVLTGRGTGFPFSIGGDWNTVGSNVIWDVGSFGFTLNGANYCDVHNNVVYDSDGTNHIYGFYVTANSTFNVIHHNMIFQPDNGIWLVAGSNNNQVIHNRLINCGTQRINDLATGTVYTSIWIPFVDGTIMLTTAPFGWEIDATTEFALTMGYLPDIIQEVRRIRVGAVALVTETDAMRLELEAYGGAPNEAYTQETITVADKASTTTNFAANDYIEWLFTPSDDTDIDDLIGGDWVMIKVLHEAAGGADAETDAAFLGVNIEYV